MMKTRFIVPLVCLLALLMPCLAVTAGVTTVKVSFDSSAIMVMGKTKGLKVEIVEDRGNHGYLLDQGDMLTDTIEIAGRSDVDTVDSGNNRVQLNTTLTLQAFDPGAYQLPPLRYVTGTGDTVLSNQLTLDVRAIDVDTTKDIFPYKPPVAVPERLVDHLPDNVARYAWLYIILIVLALLAVLALWLYHRWRKNGKLLGTKKKLPPPYDEAKAALAHLRSRALWQHNRLKEYYSGLSDILRRYVERRFDIGAVEMTSSEIAEAIAQREELQPVQHLLNGVMSSADLVKFAKMQPLAFENEQAIADAERFVELTKPVEKPKENDAEATDKKKEENAEGKEVKA